MKKFIGGLLADDIMGRAAQTSFYLMFAIFPFLLFAITLLGVLDVRIGRDDLLYVLPDAVVGLIEQLPDSSNAGVLAVPLLVSLWSASNGVAALMRGIHYSVNKKRMRQGARSRLLTLAFTLGYVLAIAVPVTLSVAVRDWAARAGAAGIIFVFMASLYMFTPGCAKTRRYATAGAAVTTVLWLLVNLAFEVSAAYIFRANPLYGGVSAFLTAMAWIYAVSLCILFGAELNVWISEAAR